MAAMIFKERTFYGKTPEEFFPQDQADLETRVANCLATVDGLDASNVSVVSRGNTILLTGTVSTIEEVERAEEAARTVEGVAEIVNRVAVA
jgi:osmotically-inducible protein OsmY